MWNDRAFALTLRSDMLDTFPELLSPLESGFMHTSRCLAYLMTAALAIPASAAEPATGELVKQVVASGGGEEKLLKLFRMKEQYNSGATLAAKGTTRESIVEPPGKWWLGNKERGAEPAKSVVWAWTLGALIDPKSVLTTIPGVTESDKPTLGLRVSGTIEPPMELYFDPAEHRLLRIDWRDDIYRFSDWKDHDGAKYPAKTVMFRKKTGQPWFYHEILEIERLKELPARLQP